MTTTLLLDIGNSALKFACFDVSDGRFVTAPVRYGWSETGLDCPELINVARDCHEIWISSVNQPHADSVCKFIKRVVASEPTMVHQSMIPMAVDVDAPIQVGIDRLLAAFAAWSMFGKSKPLIVIQVGTAVTIDLLDGKGRYQGGVILPSETTLYSSLAEKTDRLPKIEVDAARYDIDLVQPGERLKPLVLPSSGSSSAYLGKNTIDAMKLGVSNCMRGGVQWTYQAYCKQHGAKLDVIATGGGANQLVIDDMPVTLVSNLVLKGLSMLCVRS